MLNTNTPSQRCNQKPVQPVANTSSSLQAKNRARPTTNTAGSLHTQSRVQPTTNIPSPLNYSSKMQLIAAGDAPQLAALRPLLSSALSLSKIHLQPKRTRADIDIGGSTFHISRVSSEEEAKIALELLTCQNKPEALRHFSFPVAIVQSKREGLYNPVECTYLISLSPKNHLPIFEARHQKYRMRVIGKLISILAALHSIGILAGDTTAENIAIKNHMQPVFRSAGHIRAMGSMGEGISELLYLICSLISIGAIFRQEAIHLIRHYLKSDKAAYLHAKYYLHKNSPKQKNSPNGEQKVDYALEAALLSFYSQYFA
ncbi:MAG: hypothetical protein V1822_00635 [Candidatus Micrarchaeota archaeon]